MSTLEKTRLSALDPAMRDELEALLAKPTDAWLSDFQDLLVWKLAVLLLSVGGLGAWAYDTFTSTASLPLGEELALLVEYPLAVLQSPIYLGLLAALVAAPWVVVLIVQQRGRCGFAALSSALLVVRGPKVKLQRYADIKETSTRVIRSKKSSFTVLTLALKDGRTQELNVHGRWADEVQRRHAIARA